MNPLKIYVVDDDPMQLEMITDHLSRFKNFTFKTFSTGEQVLEALNEKPDIIILDYNLDSVDKEALAGEDILREIKKRDEGVEVIMYSGQDSIEVAVNTMKFGAFDYVVKSPSAFHRMENVIHRIIKYRDVTSEARRYKKMMQWTGYLVLAAIVLGVIFYMSGMRVHTGSIN
jgi:DNA-binding NtrC family response regulator